MTISTRGTSTYVMTTPGGYIKVGHSADPNRRLAEIQAQFYEPVSLYGASILNQRSPVRGYELEQLMHLKLRKYATLRREWFKAPLSEVMDAWHMTFFYLACPLGHPKAARIMPNWSGQMSNEELKKLGVERFNFRTPDEDAIRQELKARVS